MDLRVVKIFKYTCLGLGVILNSYVLASFSPTEQYRNQPALATIKADIAYNQGYSGNNVKVGVFDSGINPNHIAFTNAIAAGYDSPSGVSGTSNFSSFLKDVGPSGHGTFVASVIAARLNNNDITNNMQGVAYNAKLVVGADGTPNNIVPADDQKSAKIINYITEQSAKVMSNSWGLSGSNGISPQFEYSEAINDIPQIVGALKNAVDNNVVVVFANGNNGDNSNSNGGTANPTFPSTLPTYDADLASKGGWITVAATANDGKTLADYSNRCGVSKSYCISAPGGSGEGDDNIRGAESSTNSNYTYLSGTSFAAPIVSGAVALVAEKYPWMTNKNLATTILTTGTIAANPDVFWGRGLLDVGKAINGPGIFEETFAANVSEGINSEFSNDISGTAGLVKFGAGALSLTGDNTYTGETLIQEGKLSVNGKLNSAVDIDAHGTLRGTGTIFGPINTMGTLAPGNSPGTLTVNNLVAQSSTGILQIDIDGIGLKNGAGNYSRLIVNNNAFIAGGTLKPILRDITGNANNNFTPAIGDEFRIVTAQDGVYGYFTDFIQPQQMASNTQLDLFYYDKTGDSRNVDLVVMPKIDPYAMFGFYGNDNAKSVGKVLASIRDSSVPQVTTAHKQLHRFLADSNLDSVNALTPSLSGEIYGAMAATAPEAMYWLQNSIARQLSKVKPGNDIWVDTGVNWDRSSGSSAASGYSSTRYQAVISKDIVFDQINRFGIGITYSQAKITPQNGSGTINETAPLIYGQCKVKAVVLDSLFSYSFNTWRTERQDPLYVTQNLNNKANGNNLALGLGMRLPLALEVFNLEPFMRVLWQNSSRGGLNEDSKSPAALALPSYNLNGYRLLLGTSFGSNISDPWQTFCTYNASVGLGADLGDLVNPVTQASLVGIAYNINAPKVGREFAQLDLNATFKITRHVYFYTGLNGKIQKRRSSCGLNLGFNFN